MISPRRINQNRNSAALLSTVGAGLAGVGGGVLLAANLRPLAWWILGIGVLVHVAGMIGKRRLERQEAYEPAAWERMAYWLCWAAVAALAVYAVIMWK
jgi:hypothetical protein